ncbi:MAG: sugar phosphate isomerase/epimerase [Pirellulales bacterium]|nr:sugar phosphate isomerase/epimerase [Pirellulales bacterium]
MIATTALDRRRFIQSGAAGAWALAAGRLPSARAAEPTAAIKHAVKFGMVGGQGSLVEKFKLVKELGYDGIEMDSPNAFERDEVLRARDESGLKIHGVVDSVHWKETLSHPDPEVRARGIKGLKTAIADAQAYGASTVLLVPAVVNKEVSYADAYTRSQAEIRRVLPVAEAHGVRICFENVWNMFLLSPLEAARYIDEFDSPWVGAYFDVGNVVNYGWPEQWIRVLGKRIVKLDIKEYSRKLRDQSGPGKGFDAEIGEGDCDWPAVAQALAEVGYTQGWATAEVRGGERERLAEIKARMNRVLRG